MVEPNLLMRLMAFGARSRLTCTIKRRRSKGLSASWSARRIVDQDGLARLQMPIALIEELRFSAWSSNGKHDVSLSGVILGMGARDGDDRRVLQRLPR
jgi:hypothetical protein